MPIFGKPKDEAEEKPELPEGLDRPLDRDEEIRARRVLGLLDLGIALEDCLELSWRADIVHEAQRLVDKKCPSHLLAEILR